MTDVDAVHSRADLVEFLLALAGAQAGDSTDPISAADYIEAAAAWISDMEGYYANKGLTFPENPNWGTIAEIFSAATVYE